jgi:hypothetical protein
MKSALFTVALCLAAVATASADVRVSMQDGHVTIVAKDATVRQILTEWARVGQTKIVNIERIPGGPQTIELNNVPEAQALEVLLRSLSGYIAAPRAADSSNLSRFDRIIIMPTVASARPSTGAAPPPPAFQQPSVYTPQVVTGDDEPDDQRPPAPPANVQQPGVNRGPVFNSFPQPQVVNPTGGAPAAFPGQQNAFPNGQQPNPVGGVQGGVQQQAPQPAFGATPTAPYGGVAVPGMIAAPPPGTAQPGQQPGQMQQPIQPGQAVRRPGGQN